MKEFFNKARSNPQDKKPSLLDSGNFFIEDRSSITAEEILQKQSLKNNFLGSLRSFNYTGIPSYIAKRVDDAKTPEQKIELSQDSDFLLRNFHVNEMNEELIRKIEQSDQASQELSKEESRTNLDSVAGYALTGQHTILPENYFKNSDESRESFNAGKKEQYQAIHKAIDNAQEKKD